MDLTAGTAELAAVCRSLLADVAAMAEPAPAPSGRAGRASRAGRSGKREKPDRAARAARSGRPRKARHTSPGSFFVLLCVAGVLGVWLYSVFGGYGY